MGRIIFIFVTALKKHSRKETKAKETEAKDDLVKEMRTRMSEQRTLL